MLQTLKMVLVLSLFLSSLMLKAMNHSSNFTQVGSSAEKIALIRNIHKNLDQPVNNAAIIKKITIFHELKGHRDSITALGTFEDPISHEIRILSASRDTTIKIWDAKSSICLLTLEGHTDEILTARIMSGDFDPNYKGIIVASGSKDNTVRMWYIQNNIIEKVLILKGHEGGIISMVEAGQGMLATGSCDKTIKIWNVTTQKCIETLTSHSGEIQALVVSKDKNYFISADFTDAGCQSLKFWDMKHRINRRTIFLDTPQLVFLKLLEQDQALFWYRGCEVYDLKGKEVRTFISQGDLAHDYIQAVSDYQKDQIALCRIGIDWPDLFCIYDYTNGNFIAALQPFDRGQCVDRMITTKDQIIFSSLTTQTIYIAEKPNL